jgi:hypothetical protein
MIGAFVLGRDVTTVIHEGTLQLDYRPVGKLPNFPALTSARKLKNNTQSGMLTHLEPQVSQASSGVCWRAVCRHQTQGAHQVSTSGQPNNAVPGLQWSTRPDDHVINLLSSEVGTRRRLDGGKAAQGSWPRPCLLPQRNLPTTVYTTAREEGIVAPASLVLRCTLSHIIVLRTRCMSQTCTVLSLG